ncbi:MAG: zinc transporter ZntB [Phycisphaerales bacterium]|nr:zinc transporter ZntB [Phycisphaerales bacterium]
MSTPDLPPIDETGGLIDATILPGGTPLDWRTLAPVPGETRWVHLDLAAERARAWLTEEAGLHPLVADHLLEDETRPGAEAIGEGLLVILRGVNMNPGAAPDDMIAIRIWIEPGRVITLRRERFQTMHHLRSLAAQGAAPLTPGAFLAAVTEGLADRLDPCVDNLDEMLDDIESAMLEQGTDEPGWRATLATIRRQAISYRRYLVPQREAARVLAGMATPLLDDHDRLKLRLAAEQIARVCEALEELRDRAAVTADELRARHEERLSRTLYLLTIVATIALPLGLITGLLGVNVGGIPLSGSHIGFIVVCAVLVGVAAIEFIIFRRMRWL